LLDYALVIVILLAGMKQHWLVRVASAGVAAILGAMYLGGAMLGVALIIGAILAFMSVQLHHLVRAMQSVQKTLENWQDSNAKCTVETQAILKDSVVKLCDIKKRLQVSVQDSNETAKRIAEEIVFSYLATPFLVSPFLLLST